MKHYLSADELREDVATRQKYLEDRPETKPIQIGLLGNSFGGLAPKVASHSAKVAFIFALSGYVFQVKIL